MPKSLRTVLSNLRPDAMPDGWRLVTVGDVIISAQYGLNSPNDPDGNVKIVGMKDIKDGQIALNNLATTRVTNEELQAYRLRRGDLLINRTNSLDQVGKVGIVEADGNVVFASYLVRLAVDKTEIEPEYLNLWLNSHSAQHTIKRIATPAIGQANLNPTELQKYCLVPLPPKPEQRRIFEVLQDWSAAIKAIERLIVAKKKRLNWLSQKLLLGGMRLDGVVSEEFQDYRWFSLPNDWAYPHIGEIARQSVRTNISGEAITVLSCTKYDGLVDSLTYFGRQIFSADTAAYKIVERGEFAYATNHLEEGSIGYLDFCERGLVSPMYTVFKTDPSKVNDRFLWKVFKTSVYLHIFQANTSASVDRRGGLRWDDFCKIRIPLPSLEEQSRIDAVLSVAHREIDILVMQRAALDRQKKDIARRLFSGDRPAWLSDKQKKAMEQRAAEESVK